MQSRPILHYGSLPPLLKRKSFRRVLWLGAVLLVAVGCVYWGPTVGRWSQTIYWQHQCMACVVPANRVTVDYNLSKSITVASGSKMDDLRAKFANAPVNLKQAPPPVVFLHRLQRPDGQLRLVALEFCIVQSYRGHDIYLAADLWVPGEIGKMPIFAGSNWQPISLPLNLGDLQIFAGQIDPQNPSHFTVAYEWAGSRHIIDCWIDNVDRVLISQRWP